MNLIVCVNLFNCNCFSAAFAQVWFHFTNYPFQVESLTLKHPNSPCPLTITPSPLLLLHEKVKRIWLHIT